MRSAFTVFLRCVVGITLLWGACGNGGVAQNRTSVTLDYEGDASLRTQAEATVSSVLTELNRASYFNEQPDLSGERVTDAGRSALLEHWDRAPFRCPKTSLSRALKSGRSEGRYEVRSIPLLVETASGGSEERMGILRLDAQGRIDGVVYRSERTSPSKKGTIALRTIPSDAVVVSAIRGGTRRRSPARFEQVPSDVYAFTIRKDGYRDVVDTTFVVRSDQAVEHTVELVPEPGWLVVSSRSPGATVQIDGEKEPRPSSVQVGAGPHSVRVSKEAFTRWDSTVTVSPGDTTVVHPRLYRKQTPFVARSSPDGATVLVDGEEWGLTPLDTTLDAGRAYTVHFEKEGHVPSTKSTIVAPIDSSIERRVVLPPVEFRSRAEEARFTETQIHQFGKGIDLRYTLAGEPGAQYGVAFELIGAGGAPMEMDSGVVKGALGSDVSPGTDKRIVWQGDVPEGAKIRVTLEDADRRKRLYYIIGGAVAAGGGALAALLFGGGEDAGGQETFPPPPGFPE